MAAARGSKTPETATSSVLAYTLMVQHGSVSNVFSGANPAFDANDDDTQGIETFLLARVVNFTPSQSRTLTRVYEINNFVGGRAVEIIPGGISDDNVTISKIEGYQYTILEALDPRSHRFIDDKGNSTPDSEFPLRGGVDNLTYQKRPFHLLRYILFPNKMTGGTLGGDDINARLDVYAHCFVESISRGIDVSGGAGGLIQAEATIQVTKRRSRFLNVENSEQLSSSLLAEAADVGKFGMPRPSTGHPDYNSETQEWSKGLSSLDRQLSTTSSS
jgi:hypothetical protein